MIKNYKLFEASLTSKFEIGKKYRYNELPKSIQNEIDVQFEDGYELEDDPNNYVWEFKYLKPEDTLEFLQEWFGEYDMDDALEEPYMKRLIRDIKKNGVKKPSVSQEGKHRALACWHLGIDLPYLDPIFDPLPEDEDKINEAKVKGETVLLDLYGNDFAGSRYNTIFNIMRGNMGAPRRLEILNLINKQIGKKIMFYNHKDNKNIKKERNLEGPAYWKEERGANYGHNLYITGRDKDYLVNIDRAFGYYGPAKKRTVSLWDPYGEEDWDN